MNLLQWKKVPARPAPQTRALLILVLDRLFLVATV